MNELSSEINAEISFSRRFTLTEIWKYLDEKYRYDQKDEKNPDISSQEQA